MSGPLLVHVDRVVGGPEFDDARTASSQVHTRMMTTLYADQIRGRNSVGGYRKRQAELIAGDQRAEREACCQTHAPEEHEAIARLSTHSMYF